MIYVVSMHYMGLSAKIIIEIKEYNMLFLFHLKYHLCHLCHFLHLDL